MNPQSTDYSNYYNGYQKKTAINEATHFDDPYGENSYADNDYEDKTEKDRYRIKKIKELRRLKETELQKFRFRELINLVKKYGKSKDKSKRSQIKLANVLHEWITPKGNDHSVGILMEQLLETQIDAHPPRKQRNLINQSLKNITKASELLLKEIAPNDKRDIKISLEKSFNELINTQKELIYKIELGNKSEKVTTHNIQSWHSLQNQLTHLLVIAREVSIKTSDTIHNDRPRMGRPLKTDRDSQFYEWHSLINENPYISFKNSLRFAIESWNIYFIKQYISEDSAKKMLKKTREEKKTREK